MDNILATGISYAPHLAAFDQIAKQRLEGIDLTPLLMYIIDTTDADALPYLAEQFHALGWEGWALTTNEAERRELIKRAVELHRYKGTVWAIKNAVKAVGFDGAEVIEHVGFDYNGQQLFNGTNNYTGGEWATFRVKIVLPSTRPLTADDITRIRSMVLEYKNARSHLVDMTFVIVFDEKVLVNEDQLDLLVGDDPTDTLTYGLNYNGVGTHNGVYLYDQSNDPGVLTIEINGIATQENF